MDGLESKLNSLLSSPESMEQIMKLAQNLSSASGESSDNKSQQQEQDAAISPQLMRAISSVMNEFTKPDGTSALISALKPYLKADKRERIDRAIRLARLAKAAKTVLPDIGGLGLV